MNTGAFDAFHALADARDGVANTWIHVDGAFGLWAAVPESLRHLVDGVERADSWATDAHKWLNVPYDSGVAFTAHPESHSAAFSARAAYLVFDDEDSRRSSTGTRSTRAAPAASRSTPRSRASAERASQRWSSAAAATRGDSPPV